MFRILIATILSFTMAAVSPVALAQSKNGKSEMSSQGPQKHLSTIVFAGLAGAILGLSTLSFYGRPQDKLNNIAIGAAVGIVAGTIYSTFKVATEPREFYNLRDHTEGQLFAMQLSDRPLQQSPAPKFEFTFSF